MARAFKAHGSLYNQFFEENTWNENFYSLENFLKKAFQNENYSNFYGKFGVFLSKLFGQSSPS